MATFVKLTNGDVVNTEHIKSIKRHEYIEPGVYARYLHDAGFNTSDIGKNQLPSTPSIQLQLGSDPNPLLVKYESTQERNTEFERLEAILLGKPPVLFSTLALRPELIQSLHIAWVGSTESTLELRIKANSEDTHVVSVTADDTEDWQRAHDLIAQFALTIPKTLRERRAEMRAKGYGTL